MSSLGIETPIRSAASTGSLAHTRSRWCRKSLCRNVFILKPLSVVMAEESSQILERT
jgi:hypothetical protein